MSNLRVTSLRGRTAGTAPTLPDGAVITGVTTSTSFEGDGSALTNLSIPAAFNELDAALFN